jgi:hypothetical protein
MGIGVKITAKFGRLQSDITPPVIIFLITRRDTLAASGVVTANVFNAHVQPLIRRMCAGSVVRASQRVRLKMGVNRSTRLRRRDQLST